jgi:acylphosphatase
MEAHMGGGDVRTVRVRIAGRVQGVGYRYWTERVAGELGLSGWVRNRRDGTVEALFSGPPDEVVQMIERCRDGPPSAQVTSVDIVENAAEPAPGFEVLATQ